ncbi:MAG TPA: hypothetical protein PLD25_19585 [Chloroflexota bacterium]|nr:hypothetical protein [Chloroflexota bacterium]HUM69908.1 hypothetical protein [Chloroflexota bacterium]
MNTPQLFARTAEVDMDSRLSLEGQNEWLDYLLDFERQFENAPRISVRERIGNPTIQSLAEISLYALGEAVNNLLDLLAEHGIAVDFMGEWDDLAAYRFITEELLDEEMDDIRVEGMFSHFEATTPEYDVQMWVDIFVTDLFWQDRKDFLARLEKQPLFDSQGDPTALAQFAQKLEMIWARLPAKERAFVEPITTQVADDEGVVTAVITYPLGNEQKQIESFFRLQPSPYFGWDVVQTSLLDDLLTVLR